MFQNELKDYARILMLSDNTKLHHAFKVERIEKLISVHNANKYDHHKTESYK